jgi:ABC transport system ATP-binding/permease protein
MSERILRALMQLFAIIARIELNDENEEMEGRRIVRLFLRQQLSQKLADLYLQIFDEYIDQHQPVSTEKKERKKTSVASVKVLRICTEINEELTQKQKFIVLLRLLEFIYTHPEVTEQEEDFVATVASTFNIADQEYLSMKALVGNAEGENIDQENFLIISNYPELPYSKTLHLECDGVTGLIIVLRVASLNLFFVRYAGDGQLFINGQQLISGYVHLLSPGTTIRGAKLHHSIYYSDVLGAFMTQNEFPRINVIVDNITYHFPLGNQGLHPFTLQEESGKLVGIMGGSGSGKSTLLNILNGNLKPSSGKVCINDIDLHQNREELEGVIGYIAQDDLLIEELTVYQNLYYNARLCFGKKSDKEIVELVETTLRDLGLYEARNLKVGNPLDKTISGGQRKRVNIALELIREPMVLFVDEPTSGLSSRDSENIMDLLKELTLKGKLIFVVIHQPSSDIFKMFDRLILLDQGGYPVFNGNPIDSVIYFKKIANRADSDESECPVCGNVTSEEIFNIIESKVVDEFGLLTGKRKISPEEWYEYYQDIIGKKIKTKSTSKAIPTSLFSIPNRLKQFSVFITRDVLAKVSNLQYMLINFLEAPILAAILAYFIRFFVNDPLTGGGYVFRENENIPQYIFISVIVALFFGLTVSSEEIIRDKKILAREKFLNLSRGSYLSSKIGVMFAISAIQTLSYVLVGNLILGIKDLSLYYWLLLFTTSCFANMLGLNISATFNSAKVIYIIIPVLIIPQLLFSGVIVKFDKLQPTIGSQSAVPLIGNIMASRWAYEALAVAQFTKNEYEKLFFDFDKRRKFSNWKKDYWIKDLKNRVQDSKRFMKEKSHPAELANHLKVLKNEIEKENTFIRGISFEATNLLSPEWVTLEQLHELEIYLEQLTAHYRNVFNKAENAKENIIEELTSTPDKHLAYRTLMDDYKNESLERFVTNKNDLNYITEYNGELIQKKDLIYLEPIEGKFFDTHFYAPNKLIFGFRLDTFWANLMVIWGMSLLLILLLFVDGLRRIVSFISTTFSRLSSRKTHRHNSSIR